ncbi:MAG: GGDEF domain-containing protein, partial [Acidobacteriota bacterium]|nr:GGDEF domain-containing protein [Acidobacteriota bacterium]
IMLDLDNFKSFNDLSGHEAGDAVLREMGELLRLSVRDGDIVCRYGGEEFVIIMPGASASIAEIRAEGLRSKTKALKVQHLGHMLGTITISCGVAIFPDHGGTTSEVLRNADAALYRAKQNGRDQVVLARPLSPQSPLDDRVTKMADPEIARG